MKKYILLTLLLVLCYVGEKRSDGNCYQAGPGVIAIAGLATGVAGLGLGVIGQRQQAKAAEASAKYNASLAQQKADEERRAGTRRTDKARKDAQRRLASQRAGFAKAGVTTAGTPLSVQVETAKNEALNALLIGRESEITARQLEGAAGQFDIESQNASAAGRLAVGAELIGGVGSITNSISTLNSLRTPSSVSPISQTYTPLPHRGPGLIKPM